MRDSRRRERGTELTAGIGFRHGASTEDIVALIRQALADAGLPTDDLGAIAAAADRAHESVMVRAAAAFGLAPTPVAAEAMIAVDHRAPTRSARIEASRGVGSVAEAAALAAAGLGGRLILPRIASAAVTCALALSARSDTQGP